MLTLIRLHIIIKIGYSLFFISFAYESLQSYSSACSDLYFKHV